MNLFNSIKVFMAALMALAVWKYASVPHFIYIYIGVVFFAGDFIIQTIRKGEKGGKDSEIDG